MSTTAVAQEPGAAPEPVAASEPDSAPEPAAAPEPGTAQGTGILVSPPELEGEAPEHIAGALEQAVRDGLTDAGTEVGTAPEGCADATCMAQAAASGKARAVATTEVRITGSDYALVADIQDGEGRSLARKEGSCEICTYEEAAVALRELVAATARELGPPSDTTVPAPAIDPEPSDAPRKRMSPKTTAILAYTAIGVGVAALAGGIAMIVLDENPVKSDCSGANVDADGDCAYRYSTLGGGIGLTVAGAVVAGGGVGLLLWSRKREETDRAEVSVVPWGLRARF